MINRKQKTLLVEYFCKGYSFRLFPAIFPIIPIYDFNKIFVGNPQIKLSQYNN